MIVTAGTRNGESKKPPANHIHPVVKYVGKVIEKPPAKSQKP